MSKHVLAALGLIMLLGMSGCVAPEALEALATESAAQSSRRGRTRCSIAGEQRRGSG